jgi:hypothetical protein
VGERRELWERDAPVEVEGPERYHGQHLDLAELNRGPPEDVVYHGKDCVI